MSVTLIDCTLRDGGYYNEWDFPTRLVRRYLRSMDRAHVPVVELGFRFIDPPSYLGPTAYTTDSYVRHLEAPDSLMLGVMINAKEIVNFDGGPKAAIDRLFRPQVESPIHLVRVATLESELEALDSAIERLLELGYKVGINMMQAHSLDAGQLKGFGQWCAKSKVDIAYFADSFGGLIPSDIPKIIHAIYDGYGGPVGCHLHDNMSLALANSLAAIDAGATWIDGTIRGMGRGPGNAKTEYLAVELGRRGLADLDAHALIGLVSDDFESLHAQHNWGSNLYYFLSAANGVHPTYVQQLIADNRYEAEEIVSAIDELGSPDGAKFSTERIPREVNQPDSGSTGGWDAQGWCRDRDLLLIGPGASLDDKLEDIEAFIREQNLLVLSLNLIPRINGDLIDAYVVCNPLRAISDGDHLPQNPGPIFAPSTVADGAKLRNKFEIRNYEMNISDNHQFEVDPTGAKIPYSLVTAYALALGYIGEAARILIAGLDGFPGHDLRQIEMVTVFDAYRDLADHPSIYSITKTTYPLEERSLYAPFWSDSPND